MAPQEEVKAVEARGWGEEAAVASFSRRGGLEHDHLAFLRERGVGDR